jgi:hypothetical protein
VLVGALGAGVLGCAGARAPDATPSIATSTRLAQGRPSVTAKSTANMRAAHQLVDDPRVFDDPLALRIIGPDEEAIVRTSLPCPPARRSCSTTRSRRPR